LRVDETGKKINDSYEVARSMKICKELEDEFNLVPLKKGKHNGILYSVTDSKGNKTGRSFKSSLFGKEIGYEALQKYYERSKLAVEKKNIKEQLRPLIVQTMRQAKNINDFRLLLKKKNIGVIFRQNEAGRIYGVTFIDYPNRAVLNGSRLGKEFG
jgi:hypothetical protein